MSLYSYVVTRDYGFAPNPFWNICSLAACKPQIRERAMCGDWIIGFGGVKTNVAHKMIFLMRVDECCTFDEYWSDFRFKKKKPSFNENYQQCYGDNIYHHVNGKWMQENSHHSYIDGINKNNLDHDTRVDRVLISFCYWYFGDQAVKLPERFSEVIATSRGYKKMDNDMCEEIIAWIDANYEMGQQGFPSSWSDSLKFVRFKGEH